MARPTLTGRSARLARRGDGTLNSADLVPPPSDPTIHPVTGLPLDAEGFHDLAAIVAQGDYANSRILYVSTSDGVASGGEYSRTSNEVGSDPTNPVGPIVAWNSIVAAKARMRAGFADIMLLKRGDTFTEKYGSLVASGKTAATRTIIAAYGTGARPLIAPSGATNSGLFTGTGTGASYHIIADLHFQHPKMEPTGPTADPAFTHCPAFDLSATGATDILIENCYTKYAENVLRQATNLTWRRNVIRNSWKRSTARSSGFYSANAANQTIEESIFYKNGYMEGQALLSPPEGNHNLYLSNGNTNQSLKGCIIARACANGSQMRSGGTTENNFYFKQSVHGYVSYKGGSLSYNVAIGSAQRAETTGEVVGSGFQIFPGGQSTYCKMDNNIVLSKGSGLGTGAALSMDTGSDSPEGPNTTDIELVARGNVVVNWEGSGCSLGANTSRLRALTWQGNKINVVGSYAMNRTVTTALESNKVAFSGNQYQTDAGENGASFRWVSSATQTFAQWVSSANDTGSTWGYAPTEPTVEQYMASIGETGDGDDFIELAMQFDKGSWRSELTASAINDWFRAQLGVTGPT